MLVDKEKVKQGVIKGVISLTLRTIFLQGLQVFSLFFLQMFLEPSQIGVFFVATAASQIFTLFTDIGLGAALIQRKEVISLLDLRIVFTVQQVLVAMAIFGGIVVAPLIQRQTGLSGEGMTLYFTLLFILFISSLKAIPSILLERELAFEKQVIPQVVEAVIYHSLVLVLAWQGWGVISYSLAFLVSALAGLPVYYWISPWKLGFAFNWRRARELITFGIFYQGKSFLAIVKDNLFAVFLSGAIGTGGVGYWGTAQKWAYFPYRFIVDSVTRVTFPAYSRSQQDMNILRKGIERSLFTVSLILFPLYGIMTIVIRDLITLIPKYSKWEPVIFSFYFLCAQAAIAAITNILVNVLDATGRVKTTLWLMVLWTIGTWGITFALIPKLGFFGVAVSQFIVSLTVVLVIYLVKKILNFDFVGNVFPAMISTGIMILAGSLLEKALPASFSAIAILLVVSLATYVVCVWLLARNKITAVVQLVLETYRK